MRWRVRSGPRIVPAVALAACLGFGSCPADSPCKNCGVKPPSDTARGELRLQLADDYADLTLERVELRISSDGAEKTYEYEVRLSADAPTSIPDDYPRTIDRAEVTMVFRERTARATIDVIAAE